MILQVFATVWYLIAHSTSMQGTPPMLHTITVVYMVRTPRLSLHLFLIMAAIKNWTVACKSQYMLQSVLTELHGQYLTHVQL